MQRVPPDPSQLLAVSVGLPEAFDDPKFPERFLSKGRSLSKRWGMPGASLCENGSRDPLTQRPTMPS